MNNKNRFIVCYVLYENNKRNKYVKVIEATSEFKVMSMLQKQYNIEQLPYFNFDSDNCTINHIKYVRQLNLSENDSFYSRKYPKFQELEDLDRETLNQFKNSFEIFKSESSFLD